VSGLETKWAGLFNVSFEMYILPERKRERGRGKYEHSYARHVDKNVLKCDCVKCPPSKVCDCVEIFDYSSDIP
jgi:hypothetical protein